MKSSLKDFENANSFLVCVIKKAFLPEAKLGDDCFPTSFPIFLQISVAYCDLKVMPVSKKAN